MPQWQGFWTRKSGLLLWKTRLWKYKLPKSLSVETFCDCLDNKPHVCLVPMWIHHPAPHSHYTWYLCFLTLTAWQYKDVCDRLSNAFPPWPVSFLRVKGHSVLFSMGSPLSSPVFLGPSRLATNTFWMDEFTTSTTYLLTSLGTGTGLYPRIQIYYLLFSTRGVARWRIYF